MRPPFSTHGPATHKQAGIDPTDPQDGERVVFEQQVEQALLAHWRIVLEDTLAWLQKRTKALDDELASDKAFWDAIERGYVQAMLPLFDDAVEAATRSAIELLGFRIGIDWELVNTEAEAWAREYTYDLISQITGTEKKRLRQAVGDWVEAGEDFPALERRVRKIWENPVRARMIAETEITRVYAEADTRAWEASGVVEKRRWETTRDEWVCPICGEEGLYHQEALMGEPFPGGYMNPPAHPRCRCWVAPIVGIPKKQNA